MRLQHRPPGRNPACGFPHPRRSSDVINALCAMLRDETTFEACTQLRILMEIPFSRPVSTF